jgi:hypothetical protein
MRFASLGSAVLQAMRQCRGEPYQIDANCGFSVKETTLRLARITHCPVI